jgi:hypothetical protein
MYLLQFPPPSLGPNTSGRTVVSVAVAFVTALLVCDRASANWPADGVVLCGACRARGELIASDGAGGAFVVWTDERNSPTGVNDDIYLQRVTASGAISLGWPADGLAVCLAPGIQGAEYISPDGFGGVIVAWRDYRNAIPGGTGSDIYAQRVLANGTIATGWQVDGTPVTLAPEDQVSPVVLGDGNGGAFFTWDEEYASQPDVHAQRLAPDGTVAPSWPPGGFTVCSAAGLQAGAGLTRDGTGGFFVMWQDLRDGTPAVYAGGVTAAGQLSPGWPQNGIRIVANRYQRGLVADGTGGAYLSCATAGSLYDANYYLQRFTGTGAIAPGWPDGGALVCQAPDERVGLRMEPDVAGGALLVWSDYRDHFDDDIYALRMRSDGTRDPTWPANGLAVTNNTALDDYPDLAPDGAGGAYLCWDQYSSATGDRLLIQHLTSAGSVAPGWPSTGLVVPSDVVSLYPHIVADGVGGAIVTWCDRYGHTRALRLAADGPVVVGVSLVSAEAEPDRARLTWFTAEGSSPLATVERRTETSEWEPLGTITANGSGQLQYEDRAVTPGSRYAYRLSYADGAATAYSAETWVTIPAPRFALRGLTPNPSYGDPVVAFSLLGAEPATLELFDLAGRHVVSREVGSLGAGVQSVRLEGRGRLPAGIYTVRLRQGARVATTRAVVVR